MNLKHQGNVMRLNPRELLIADLARILDEAADNYRDTNPEGEGTSKHERATCLVAVASLYERKLSYSKAIEYFRD